MAPRDCFLKNDFSFITSFAALSDHSLLSTDIDFYNQSRNFLFANFISFYNNDKLSKTKTIINIYHFFRAQYDTLINIRKKSHEQMLLAKESEDFKRFQQIIIQSQEQLKDRKSVV